MLLLLLSAACSHRDALLVSGDEVVPDDTGAPADTGEARDGYDFLFDLDEVHAIDITLDDGALAALEADPFEYVEGAVAVDGETFESVGVRLKGQGSWRPLDRKAAFKIDFNRFDEDQSFHGKGKLTLNNMVWDYSQMAEVMAYAAFAAAGLPASRTGYAWVTVNGEDYGLYVNVETWDRDFLDRNFGNRDGNLYEGGLPYFPDSYAHAEFTSSGTERYPDASTQSFQLESGTDVANADLWAVTHVLEAGGDDLEPGLAALVDLDAYARFQIMEAWTGQYDGYAFSTGNYRVFVDHGGSGLLYFVPSGLDLTFADEHGYMSDYGQALGVFGAVCQADAACNAHFAAVLEDTLAAVDAAELEALLDHTEALIAPYVAADPRSEIYSEEERDYWVDVMRGWLATRSDRVREWYAP